VVINHDYFETALALRSVSICSIRRLLQKLAEFMRFSIACNKDKIQDRESVVFAV